MKIARLEDFHTDGAVKVWSFLKITTDDGCIGWAEYNESGLGSFGLSGVIHKLAEHVIGMDPRATGALNSKLHAVTRVAPGGLNGQAAAAIENACLDIRAKALGVPVYDLFGGPVRERIPLYWSHCGYFRVWHGEALGTPPIRGIEDIRLLGKEVAEAGYRALKTNLIWFEGDTPRLHRPGHGSGQGHPERNLDRRKLSALLDQMAALQDGAGPDVDLIVDLNFNFRPEPLHRIAKELEKYNPAWLEADCHDPGALARLRQSTTTPIGSLETLYGRQGYLPYLQCGAVDIAIVDPLWNGLVEAVKIAALADAFELNVAPHTFGSPFHAFMNAHYSAAIPNLRIMEFDHDVAPWQHELFSATPDIENGYMAVPTLPGWGIEVNEQALLDRPPRRPARAP